MQEIPIFRPERSEVGNFSIDILKIRINVPQSGSQTQFREEVNKMNVKKLSAAPFWL